MADNIKTVMEQLIRQAGPNAQVIDRGAALQHINVNLLKQYKVRQASAAAAVAKPLPGPLAHAFLQDSIAVAGYQVYKTTPRTWTVLQAIDSPLIKLVEQAIGKNEDITYDYQPQEIWDLCWVFTHPIREVWKKLQLDGAQGLRSVAEVEVGEEWNVRVVNLVMLAVMEQVKREIETGIKFGAELEKGGQLSFLKPPA